MTEAVPNLKDAGRFVAPVPIKKRIAMGAAGVAFLYLAFSNSAENQSPGSLPLMLLFIPVGVGLLTGSRHACWLGRICMWLLMALFTVLALGMYGGQLRPTVSPEHIGMAFTVWLGLGAFAAFLLRVRLGWSRRQRQPV